MSYYRKGFEQKLPEIFGDLNVTYTKIEARTKAEAFRQVRNDKRIVCISNSKIVTKIGECF